MSDRNLATLQKSIGYTFSDISLLEQATTHRSYLNENPTWPVGHNERLEFLGDAVLELVVTEYLYEHYPHLRSQWLPPTPPRPLAFPTPDFGSRLLQGNEKAQRKRTSCSKSLGLEQKERILSRKKERDCDRYFDRHQKGLDRS